MSNAVATIEQVGTQIDNIVEKCLPITSKQAQGFNEALILAEGIKSMRDLFLNNQGIQANVEAMANTSLGFMTDRSPDIIKANNAKGKKALTPYTYDQIAECCIEAMLQGYRITGNEFNIISGRFYPAKNGKYRKIIENETVSNFFFTTTSPIFSTEQRMNYSKVDNVQVAKVQCFATWTQDETNVRLGYDDDKLVFKIKANAFMGDDGIVGKALSKLFSRVLMRIEGYILPETTDIDDIPVVNQEKTSNTNETLSKASKKNPLHDTPEWKEWADTAEAFPEITSKMPEPATTKQCEAAVKEVKQAVDLENA